MEKIIVKENNIRIDSYLVEQLNMSRSKIKKHSIYILIYMTMFFYCIRKIYIKRLSSFIQ